MIAEWNGSSAQPGAGGNGAAYYRLANFVAKRTSHATLVGRASKRGTVTIQKSFRSPTSPVLDSSGEPGAVRHFADHLSSRGAGEPGRTVPLQHESLDPAARRQGQRPRGIGSTKRSHCLFRELAAGATACFDSDSEDPSCWNDHPFTVPKARGRDNDSAAVRLEACVSGPPPIPRTFHSAPMQAGVRPGSEAGRRLDPREFRRQRLASRARTWPDRHRPVGRVCRAADVRSLRHRLRETRIVYVPEPVAIRVTHLKGGTPYRALIFNPASGTIADLGRHHPGRKVRLDRAVLPVQADARRLGPGPRARVGSAGG